MVLFELWNRRERSPKLTRRWFVSWIRRVRTLPAMLRVQWRAARLRARGGQVGALVFLEDCSIEGTHSNLDIARGVFIGEGSELVLHDRIVIGAHAVINRRVTILTGSHRLDDPMWSLYTRPVHIGERAWIATGATLLPGVSIGRGAVVGAGAVVRSDVPDYALATGNPATIREGVRTTDLRFEAPFFPAPFEAWLGAQKSLLGATPV
jgi:acetyltransferase-like isoleucine patch superfamily enzyme